LNNSIRKKLQYIFKSIAYGLFKIFYGSVSGIINPKSDLRVKISKAEFPDIDPFIIYSIKSGRIYTDTINNTAFLIDKKIIDGPSFQLKGAKYESIEKNTVFSIGTPRIKKNLKGSVLSLLTGGAGNDNYWHWMFDVLPKIAIIEKFKDLNQIDFFLFPNTEKPFQKQTLDLLEIPKNKRLSAKKTRHLTAENIISTEHPYVRKNFATIEIQNIPEWIIKWLRIRFLNEVKFNSTSLPKKIYIDRSDSESNSRSLRKIINEKEVIDFMIKKNYSVIKLRDLDFIDQVRLFNQAESVVGLHGAGFANIIFGSQNSKVLEIKPHTAGEMILNLAKKNNIEYSELSLIPTLHDYNNQLGHILVPINELEKKLR
tara:strand:+ start:96 stop:1205 length:1110 start_codon:yes stop_codon:yes gene_type:complete